MKLLPIVMIVLVCLGAQGYEVSDADLASMRAVSVQYLAVTADQLEIARFAKKIKGMISQRVLEGDTKDSACQAIALDWFSDNQKALRQWRREAIIYACWWFVHFADEKVDLPNAVTDNLTEEDVQEFLKTLKARIKEERKDEVKDATGATSARKP